MIDIDSQQPFFDNNQEFEISDIKVNVDMYREAVEASSRGPQTEGVDSDTVENLLREIPERVLSVESDGRVVPVFFRTTDVDVMSQDYLESRYGRQVAERSLYFSPSTRLSEQQIESIAASLRDEAGNTTAAILYEEQSGNEWKTPLVHKILDAAGLTFNEDSLIDPKNNTEAAIIHYSGLAYPEMVTDTRGYARLRDVFEQYYAADINSVVDGVTFLDSEKFKDNPDLQEYIWQLCSTQFNKVVENLPVRQSPTREELIEMLSHPDTSTVMYVEDGTPITLCVFAHSIDACEWLRKPYFDSYANEWLGYYAFLVTDENRLGERKSHEVLNTIIDLVNLSKQPLRVVFECTNISADYIPYGIVQPVINASGNLNIDLKEDARYTVKSIVVNPENDNSTSQ